MKKKTVQTKSRILDKIRTKKSFNKINKPVKGKFKKPLDEEKKGWLHEEEDWKKDELEEPEKSGSAPIAQTDKEDDWKEKDGILEDDEDIKILDEDLLGEEDKDNY